MAKCSPIDPALLEDGVAAFDTYIRNTLTRTECCMPGIVLSFDRISHTALIQPLCDFVTNTGDSVQRKPITMHVWRFACGGKIIDFPMRKGDTGWIIASDYDSFLQKINNSNIDESKNKGSSNPNTAESHSYRHGFFMPDSFCSFPDISRFGDDLVLGEYDKEGNITAWSGGGGGGGGSGGGSGMFAWTPPADGAMTGTIGPGGVFVSRKFYTIASSSGNSGTALYSVKVEFGSGGAITASVVSNATLGQSATDTTCYIPIYKVEDWEVVNDYRGAFVVPCWE